MKALLPLRIALLLTAASFFTSQITIAQCNVNDKYDKIISGYHTSIAQKTDGSFAVWGPDMSADGTTDVLKPQDINVTNYPALTGTVLKAALGGNTSNSSVDEAILLTSTGLWAWGIRGVVVKDSLTTNVTFQKIKAPKGANSYALPTGLTPDSVSSLFATYQTLIILTKGGLVYILTNINQAAEAQGSTGSIASSTATSWKQVKTAAGSYLTNVVAVRGQASSSSYNAFLAMTADGKLYTWGNSSYLGDGNAAAARNYATQMPTANLPAEFSTSIPKMIGVTGGIGYTASGITTGNTYFLLGNSGKLYALGENSQHQCGDFGNTENRSWVIAKINNSTQFTNITSFSVQEHNSSYPAVAVITTSGLIYTWGSNSNGMLGRTTDGTTSNSNGNVGNYYDPGLPIEFNVASDKAISCEMGGHTLVYLRNGTSQFCYVGHKTGGSMGDNSSASSTQGQNYYASCTGTPSLAICGYVPTSPAATLSTIRAAASQISGNGNSTTTVTIQLKDTSGANLTVSGGNVVIFSTKGTVSNIIDNNNGTYTATLTSANTVVQDTTQLTYTINGTLSPSSASVIFTSFGMLQVTWKTYRANRVGRNVIVAWSTFEDEITSYYSVEKSFDGNTWKSVVPKVKAQHLTGTNYYTESDTSYSAARIFFRIRQTGKDGDANYSPVMQVGAETSGQHDAVTVYPFPATSSFRLGNVTPDKLMRVQLYNMNGNAIKAWAQPQDSYGITELPRGMYLLKVEMKDGSVQQLRVSKN